MTNAFEATSTTGDVLMNRDLSGIRVLVTGVSSGLGWETARALVSRGAHVVGAVRDLVKARRAGAEIRTHAANGGELSLVALDLASLEGVRACSDALMRDGRSFDVVIANAGVMRTPYGHTVDGFETQFGTNHLGHFAFVNRIEPLIATGGRLVVLSSTGHRTADVDLIDPNFEHMPYDAGVAYGRSKTANILFSVAFDRRHRTRGIRATAVHPGVIKTALDRSMTPEEVNLMLARINAALATEGRSPFQYKSLAQGAATSVWAAVVANAEEIGGRYCEDCGVSPVVDQPDGPLGKGVMAYAVDAERAEALWSLSERMIGERF
ncbi:SDR family NAD(P)-dependent oxidoreductase [Pandoraea sp. NPDC087047]|uniref:SDR family NAD(P)-dependent oxidoreductase n=1 Tax=Pandoraea sp. NPDC087047 TaxID=3364390 RepID=UPI0038109731